MKLYQSGPHMHISYYRLSKFYEHLVLAPKSLRLRDFFFYLPGFAYMRDLLSLTSPINHTRAGAPRAWPWAPAGLRLRTTNRARRGAPAYAFDFPRENLGASSLLKNGFLSFPS